jgi:hypothetical protein
LYVVVNSKVEGLGPGHLEIEQEAARELEVQTESWCSEMRRFSDIPILALGYKKTSES